MNHSVASLLHYVANETTGDGYTRIQYSTLCAAIPEARELGLVESPDTGRGPVELLWLRLAVRGRNVVDEMLSVGRELVGG